MITLGIENLVNIEDLTVSDCKLQSIEGLENLTKIKSLILDMNQITEMKGLSTLVNLEVYIPIYI